MCSHEGFNETHFIQIEKSSKFPITSDTYVCFSKGSAEVPDYHGYASDMLTNAYKFSRKEKPKAHITVSIDAASQDYDLIVSLVVAKNRSKELANSRGDEDGVPQYFEKLSVEFAKKNNLDYTIFCGDELVKERFNLMHAVGRASKNKPVFVNIKYNGNPESDKWVAFVGKGVCFDAGGLNIKPSNI